jgi:hypothetical protein
MSRRWLIGLVVTAVALAGCGSSLSGSGTTESVNPRSIDVISCPNTWQLTSVQRGLNSGTKHSVLAATVIPPASLWVAFCLYGEPPSASSNASGTETLVREGATLANNQRALIMEINDGEVIKSPAQYQCPNDNGQTYLLLFTYLHRPIVRVAASLFGCAFITNGVTTVSSPSAHGQLLAMAGTQTQGGPPLPTTTTGP